MITSCLCLSLHLLHICIAMYTLSMLNTVIAIKKSWLTLQNEAGLLTFSLINYEITTRSCCIMSKHNSTHWTGHSEVGLCQEKGWKKRTKINSQQFFWPVSPTPTIIMHEVKWEGNCGTAQSRLQCRFAFHAVCTMLFLQPYISTDWFLCPLFCLLEPV